MTSAIATTVRKAGGPSTRVGGAIAALFLLGVATCGSNPPPGPIISSFGAGTYDITEGQTIHVIAALSDADMGPLKAGIKGLLTDGGSKIYGSFSSTMPGLFTYDISWTQLDNEKRIAFDTEETRNYTAQFIDDYGNIVERQFTVRLHCGGDPACEGHCVKLGAACPVSKTLQCLSGQCGIGCVIGNHGYLDGAKNPANPCQVCDIAQSQTSFTNATPYTSCAQNLSCSSSAQCTEPFRLRESTNVFITQLIAPAPDARLAVADDNSSTTGTMLSAFSGTDKFTATALPGPGNSILHAVDANTIFRLTGNLLEVSKDGGRSFTLLRSRTGYADALWASSANDIWYSQSGNPPVNTYVHFHSTNGGSSFTTLTGVTGVADQIFGTGANNVFVLERFGNTLFHSTNGGVSFTKTSYAFSGTMRLLWGSSETDLYLGTSSGLYHSVDNYNTFSKVTPPTNSQAPTESILSIHGCGSKDVFIANRSEIWRSTDGLNATLITRYAFPAGAPGWVSVACTAPGKMVAAGSTLKGSFIIESY